MNPSFKKDEHALALDLHTRQPDMTVVLETAEYYRLGTDQAEEIVSRVNTVVGGWKARARRLGLSVHEISEAEHLFQPDV
jgi:serine/threonine-protein kinase HipA